MEKLYKKKKKNSEINFSSSVGCFLYWAVILASDVHFFDKATCSSDFSVLTGPD